MLSIAGARLGYGPVTAVDIEAEAVEATAANAAGNGVEVDVRLGDALAGSLPAVRTAVANVTLESVSEIAPRLDCERLVTSGYLASERPEPVGFRPRRPARCGGLGGRPLRARDRLSSRAVATFTTSFLGCKVSQTDARALRERLLADGHTETDAAADVAVVNTCCVTHEAVAKSRKAAARAARRHGRVYVTGAARTSPPTPSPGCRRTSSSCPGGARRRPPSSPATSARSAASRPTRGLDRVRAFVKIQDGCSFSCAFCVIPLVRGGTRSRRAGAVLDEIRRRVAQGHREVVLTGVNLGCFRDREAGYDLPRLVREAGEVPGLERLRLSSIELNHLTPALLAALRETPVVSPHLHVPLQSGDDGVLRAMARRYDAGQYLARVEPLEDFNVTSDVIVGFPGEDEAAFRRTLDVVRRARITKVHVFPYSPRPGTVTAAADTVPAAVKRERSARLREASRDACLARWRSKLGREDVVLIDRPGRGYGDDYSPWLVDGPVGELVRVRGAGVTEEGILAA